MKAVVVWKLDRLSRSLKDLIFTIEELESRGIDFVSYGNQIDTTTPSGKLLFQVVGAVAEFEREIISERVKLGLKNARRKGKRLGRPPISQAIVDKAKDLRKEGLSYRKISGKLGLKHSVIYKRLNSHKLKEINEN